MKTFTCLLSAIIILGFVTVLFHAGIDIDQNLTKQLSAVHSETTTKPNFVRDHLRQRLIFRMWEKVTIHGPTLSVLIFVCVAGAGAAFRNHSIDLTTYCRSTAMAFCAASAVSKARCRTNCVPITAPEKPRRFRPA